MVNVVIIFLKIFQCLVFFLLFLEHFVTSFGYGFVCCFVIKLLTNLVFTLYYNYEPNQTGYTWSLHSQSLAAVAVACSPVI